MATPAPLPGAQRPTVAAAVQGFFAARQLGRFAAGLSPHADRPHQARGVDRGLNNVAAAEVAEPHAIYKCLES